MVRKADNLTTICEPTLENVGTSTSPNPMVFHDLLTETALPFSFYLFTVISHKIIFFLEYETAYKKQTEFYNTKYKWM
jgi:hypothetical protein